MSYETTLARAEWRGWDSEWRAHRAGCVQCIAAARKRSWRQLCPAGAIIRAGRTEAKAALEQERWADRQPALARGRCGECRLRRRHERIPQVRPPGTTAAHGTQPSGDRSPAVLGHPLNVRLGSDRRSVRVPNPGYQRGGDEPKTRLLSELVRT